MTFKTRQENKQNEPESVQPTGSQDEGQTNRPTGARAKTLLEAYTPSISG